MNDPLSISFADIEKAQSRIDKVAHHTPVLTSRTFNTASGVEAFFKCENFQRMGAFKFRGAYNALSKALEASNPQGFIAFSSGNHAQAVALSAKILNKKAVIVMPKDAPQIKVQATEGYGAEVVFYDRYTEDREQITQRLALEQNLILIPPFNHPDVMAGQGTAAAELLQEIPDLDVLLVCLGGGGLLSGCAVAAKHINPGCRVIGVEPRAGNDAQQSFKTGSIVKINTPQTIADGAQTQSLGSLTFPVIQNLVDDIWTVTDDRLIETMKFFAQSMKMIVEPTGCLAAAAVLFAKQAESVRLAPADIFAAPASGAKVKKVGVIVSGGNVDLGSFAKWVG
ncbi:MAG: threo-3-hydroxy-L-aspartate ammonia-lyase [Pseudobdellovibrionaceae bacterium]